LINPELEPDQIKDLRELVSEYNRDIFSDVPRLKNLAEHKIKVTTDVPIKSKPYPLPYAMRSVVDDELDVMLKLGVIEPCNSVYASPLVVIKKADQTNRMCVDFRKLNLITVFDAESMPNDEYIQNSLQDCKFYSKFDLSKGFWRIPIAKDSKKYTTVTTHRGSLRFLAMPFGLVNAPASFNRLMRKLLGDMKDIYS